MKRKIQSLQRWRKEEGKPERKRGKKRKEKRQRKGRKEVLYVIVLSFSSDILCLKQRTQSQPLFSREKPEHHWESFGSPAPSLTQVPRPIGLTSERTFCPVPRLCQGHCPNSGHYYLFHGLLEHSPGQPHCPHFYFYWHHQSIPPLLN